MERNREVRRWSVTASANGIGLSRRPHRITSLRESTEEEGQVELRLRDREQRAVQKKERDRNRDREMISQSKRRRLERYAPRTNNNNNNKDNKDVEATGGGQDSSAAEESFDEDYCENYGGKAPLSTFKLNHDYQKTRSSSPVLRVADEMIGVPVPRRARSGSVKRSNESWNSGVGGFGEEQSHQRLLCSPLSRNIDGFSPSYSSLPTRKKMKPQGPKTQIPKISSEPSSSVHDDIEIEVVEALFDLMKQSQSQNSRKFEGSIDKNFTEKLDSFCNKAADDKPISSPIISAKIDTHISDLPQEASSFSNPLLDVESKKKGDDDGKVGESVRVSASNVSTNEIKAHNEEPITLKSENPSPKIEILSPNNSVPDGLEQRREAKVGKRKDPKEQAEESVVVDEVVTEESRTCAESNADGSTNPLVPEESSTSELAQNKMEAKFQIDLMVPPPMPSSLKREKDGLTEIGSSHEFVSADVQKKSENMTKDDFLVSGKRHEGKQKQTIDIMQEFARLDFEKPHKDNFNSGYNRQQQRGQNEQIQCKMPLSEGKDIAQTNSLPFPIAVTGWPGGYHPGYFAPLQTAKPLDRSAKPSAQLQSPPFSLAHLWPKRSTTHQHIARSIRYHQQLTKNCTWPVASSPATLNGSRTCNINPAPSAPNSILGKPLRGELPAGQVLASKSSEVPNFVDAAKTKQLVLQQASQQSPAGNLVRGPAFILPLGQHQATGAPTSQAGPTKSAKAIGKLSLLNNSAGGPPVNSSSLPGGAATVSFNGSNLPSNEAPSFMTILQNNGYPFSISTNGGIPPPIKAAEAPFLPFFNTSYYPSMFPVTQVQQQPSTSQSQSTCMHLVQLAPQATSTSSGSLSFHKQSLSQQKIGSKTSGHHSLVQQQQSRKRHVAASPVSSKFGKEISRQDSAIVVDSRESCAQKASDGKSLAIPVQPINVALMSHAVLDSHGGNNYQYPQQKGSKCNMEVTPPQAFALSFGSMDSCTPALNFSSVSQNPAVFQMVPDVAKGGYQLVHAVQVAQQKNFLVAEGKSVVGAGSNDDETKGILGKSAARSFNFSNFGSSNTSNSSLNETDGSARILNVLPSAHAENQRSGSSSSALTAAFSVNPPNCPPQQQQQELIQLPKQHLQQMQMMGVGQATAPTSTNIPCSFSGSNLSLSNSIASQNLVQNIHSQLSLWKNTSLATTSPTPSLANTSNLKNLTQQQPRNSRQMQISFGGSSNSPTAFQGQQIVINSLPASSLVDVSPSNSSRSKNTRGSGSMEATSGGHKMRPTTAALPSQQTEISLNGPSPKSSPVCGRNVPSILGTCPSQLSELKY